MNTNTSADPTANILFGSLTLPQVAEVFGSFFELLMESELHSIDASAPPCGVTHHVARLEAERLFTDAQSGELDAVAQCDAYIDTCRELGKALPAVLPLRPAETYEALRRLLQSFAMILLSVRMDLAAKRKSIGD